MKRLSLLLILFLPLCMEAHIPGIVVDEQNEPLVGANVYWAGTTIGTSTNIDGLFEVEPIRQTKYLVTSYLGYRNDTTLVTSRDPLVIVLSPNDKLLDEVTITERKMGVVRARLSAFDTQTLGTAELCKAACCNLAESFETSASVDVAYSDAATGATQIRLLGLSGMYVQLLGENCPAVRGLAQNFGMEYIPGPWMESIQVSKGTSSVKNGYEAITGQINVEYLKPQLQNPIDVNVMLNTMLHAEANIMGGWDIPIPNDPLLGELSTGVLAHYQNGSFPMDDNRDGFLEKPLNQNLNILNRWYYKNDKYTFQFLIRGLHDERHGGQRTTHYATKNQLSLPSPAYEINLNTDRIDGFMKNGFILDEETGMSIGIITSASYHKQHNLYGSLDGNVTSFDPCVNVLRNWNADQWNAYLNAVFENTWEGGDILGGGVDNDHKLSVGLSLNYDKYGESIEGITPKNSHSEGSYSLPLLLDRQEVTPGMYAEYTYKIAEQFSMIAGLRADWSSCYGLFFTPRLNVRYAPFDWWTIRASAGMGYRTPNLIADYAQFLPTARLYSFLNSDYPTLDNPNKAWEAAQEKAVNAGASTTFYIPVGSRQMTLTADYYYTRFLDGVVADIDVATNQVQFFNMNAVEDAQSFSHNLQLEASLEILRGWTMTAAFRYTDVRQTSWNATANEYQLREKPLANRFKGVITTSYVTPLKKWQFDLTAQFNGGGRMPDGFISTFTDANSPLFSTQYYEKNGSLYYKWYPQLMGQITKYWRTCSLYVGAENMTNFMQDNPILGERMENGMVNAFTPNFDASMVWAPTSGWEIYAGFRWSLERKDD